MKRCIVPILLVFFLVSNAIAQDEKTDVHKLDQIVVTATTQSKMLDTPASISIITAEELEETGAKDIVEALRKIPGVDDTSSKNSAITIRGTRSSMAGGPVILIDGVPQKIGDYRYDEFSFIPVFQIERIEVLRSAGIAYGPGAARGVINVITKKGRKDKPLSFDGSLSYGSWNTHDEYVGLSGRSDQWDYFLNASNYSTDGYEDEETDRVSGLLKLGFNVSDQTRIGIRGNIIQKDSKSVYGFVKKDWHLEHYREDIHFPVSETDPTMWWHTEKDQDDTNVALELSHRSEKTFINSALSWTGYEEDFKDLHYLYVKPKNVYHDDKEQDAYTFTFSGGYNAEFGGICYTPSFGITFEDLAFDQTRIYPNNPDKNTAKYNFEIDETHYGMFWDNDFLFGDHWGMRIGGRWDKAEIKLRDKVPTEVDQDDSMFSWLVAPSYHLSKRANIYASAGRNYWFPTPRYYAWAAEKGGELNRPEDLKPEESMTYELGYKHLISKAFNIRMTTYFTDYKDKFSSIYDHSNNKSLGQKNVGEAEAKGIELEIDGRVSSFFGYRFAGTYQNIEWKSGEMRVYEHPSNDRVFKDLEGYDIYGIPEYSGVFGFDLYPLDGLKCSADINYTGKKYVDYTNTIEYDAKTTVDVNISYRMKNWKFWFLGKNIFDEEVERVSNSTGKLTGADGEYDNAYYIQDGAYFEAGVSYHF
ncbi:TonB-dependent receptor [Desulfonema magnum]|uniref:TonB-dependent receptor-like superfamily protein n=1 Tax=Desulfonema magnum TaxID=45655 RepID=A0A975BIS2_9BACT|nr:TonB-dependent receptor [Desulfonema magnum]QTA85899.1 TonB-dependent receptor-like superfamily protein [Desulfonema magnum]